MPYQATVFQVMIASPSDVPEERRIAKEIILEWNDINSQQLRIILQPVGWKENSFPEMGGEPQGILNKQILENSDLLIAIFWTRIGTPTDEFISGSVEEFERHLAAGKPAMLYFSEAPINPKLINKDQYRKLEEFREAQLKRGVVETVSSAQNFEEKFRKQLALTIQKNNYFKEKRTLGVIDSLKKEPTESDLISNLTEEEKLAIIETSMDRHGQLGKIPMMGEFIIQANGKRLNLENTPRTKALWEQTIEDLINKKLIKRIGQKGTLFALTQLGFNIADKLKESQNT